MKYHDRFSFGVDRNCNLSSIARRKKTFELYGYSRRHGVTKYSIFVDIAASPSEILWQTIIGSVYSKGKD